MQRGQRVNRSIIGRVYVSAGDAPFGVRQHWASKFVNESFLIWHVQVTPQITEPQRGKRTNQIFRRSQPERNSTAWRGWVRRALLSTKIKTENPKSRMWILAASATSICPVLISITTSNPLAESASRCWNSRKSMVSGLWSSAAKSWKQPIRRGLRCAKRGYARDAW